MMKTKSSQPPAPGLRFRILDDPEAVGRAAAGFILRQIQIHPRLLLCLATGGSPALTYRRLVDARRRQRKIFDQMRVLKLDEWGGLSGRDRGSSEYYLQEHFLRPAEIRHYTGFRGNASNPARECERMAAWLAVNGPIDIALLGLGLNGHLALNEPAKKLEPFCHVARLSARSLRHPMLAEARRRPRYGLTIGMADIARSRQVILLVTGSHKRAVLQRLFRRELSADFPASFLWLHSDAVCLCDRAAAGDGIPRHIPIL